MATDSAAKLAFRNDDPFDTPRSGAILMPTLRGIAMDEETRVFVAAELTKINFLLENLFAVVLHNAGATPDDIPALSAELERQAELPGTTYNAPANDTEESDAVQELVRSRIVKFFDGVEKRLRSAEQ